MVDYNRCVKTESGVYSIDWFSFKFMFLTTTDLFDSFYSSVLKIAKHGKRFENFSSSKYGNLINYIRSDGVSIGFVPSSYSLYVQFNPNKVQKSSVLEFIFGYLHMNCSGISFKCARCDYTYDIPLNSNDLMVLTRKTEGHFKTTRYYGVRGSSGYLRVYDKREEIKKKEKFDIGYDLCRLEWEQRNDEPFHFDSFSVPDFSGLVGYAKWIKYVDPAFYNQALNDLSKDTKYKVKKKIFSLYPFDPSNFDKIRNEYFNDYGLLNTYREFPYMGIPEFDSEGNYVPVPAEVQLKRWKKLINNL